MSYTWTENEDLGEKHRLHHNAIGDSFDADLSGIINVKNPAYAGGAVGDGIADDTAAIQAAVDAIGTNGGVLFFPPETYLVSSPGIILPGGSTGYRFEVLGYGATLKATTAISMLKRATPTDMTDAVNRTTPKFIIRGLNFLGNNTASQVGLDMWATFGLLVEDCSAEDCDTNFRVTFGLKTLFRNCQEKEGATYGFHVRSGNGLWSGAGLSNSGSNHTKFDSCRSYGVSTEDAQFLIEGSSGVRLEDCITEGGNPIDAIKYDAQSGTVDKYFSVKNHHSENTPTGAVIRLIAMGRVEIDGLWHQTVCKMIDATGSNASAVIHVKNLPFIPASATFKGDAAGAVWVFDHPGGTGADNLYATSFWDGGTVAGPLSVIRQIASGNAGFKMPNLQIRPGGGSGLFDIFANPTDAQPFLTFWTGAGGSLSLGPGGATAPDLIITRAAASIMGIGGNGGGVQFTENGTTDLAAGGANTARLYCKDNGAGKTQLVVRFNSGAVQVIATEP